MDELKRILAYRRSKLTEDLILEASRLQKKFIREDMDKVRSNRLYKLERIFKGRNQSTLSHTSSVASELNTPLTFNQEFSSGKSISIGPVVLSDFILISLNTFKVSI